MSQRLVEININPLSHSSKTLYMNKLANNYYIPHIFIIVKMCMSPTMCVCKCIGA